MVRDNPQACLWGDSCTKVLNYVIVTIGNIVVQNYIEKQKSEA